MNNDNNILISGFSDEIAADFEQQLQTVKKLGMCYISLRSADKKNIADYTLDEVEELLLPRLAKYGIGVSSLGSPIGKIDITDEDAFEKQLEQLNTLCKSAVLLKCRYIRMFSFYMPEGTLPSDYKEQVVSKLSQFAEIAKKHDIVLIHENEKDIFGDTALRCKQILDEVNSPSLKAVFDFANFVQVGEDTIAAWELLKSDTVYIHIKDAVKGVNENVVCGSGDGNIAEILADAINNGYTGFLTLEPHLFMFDSLQSLEKSDAKDIIKENKAQSGMQAYEMQHNELLKILKTINEKGEI